MNGPNTGRLWKYVAGQLRLRRYLDQPGDGRQRPDLPARGLLWALLLGQLLRTYSFHGVEALVRSRARRNLRLPRRFGDDALGYFTARLDPGPTRDALAQVVRQAKRNKAFASRPWLGLALDGTTAGRRSTYRS